MTKSQRFSNPVEAETVDTQLDQPIPAVTPEAQQQVAVPVEGKLVTPPAAGPNTRRLLDYLRARAADAENGTEAVWESIAAQIFGAESADGVLADNPVLGAEDVLDVVLELHAVSYRESDFVDGINYYAVCTVSHVGHARQFTLTCGGLRVIMQCVKLEWLDALPVRVIFKEAGKPTKNGYRPLRLVAGTPF